MKLPGSSRCYLMFNRKTVRIRNLDSGRSLETEPFVALDASGRVVALGGEARDRRHEDALRVVNPFDHPRTPCAHFAEGEILVRHMLKSVTGNSWLAAAPALVMHYTDDLKGGMTAVEARAFREMGLGAGARAVYLVDGPEPLSPQQLDATLAGPAETPHSDDSTTSWKDSWPTIVIIILALIAGWFSR